MPRLLLPLVLLAALAPAAPAAAAPLAVTGPAKDVTQTTATLTGTVNPRGVPTKVFFRLGPTRQYGARTAAQPVGSGNKKIQVRIPVSELTPDTVYHYRLVADGNGVSRGKDRTFRTPKVVLPPPPEPAKMQLSRATIFQGARVIDILAPITRRASGSVSMQLYAAGKRHRWTAPVNSTAGHIRVSESIPRRQARMGTGILTVRYPGDPDTRPQTVRLRAANVPAALDARRPTIVNGRLQAGGTISRAARGVVRVQLQYFADEQTTTLQKYARISGGAWSLDEPLTPEEQAAIARRRGTVHSYILFTGYLERRMRGEMRSYQVLGPR